eukprot:CAMPEP_0183795656 /NCGR_PEP_ID=MMETSP0803_2-20130417/4963_1 /TAXON_ID=195967 /ORGANISM="Crustomastix stigmata, Strain CCMP3273" /LENGTH=260 /DNA_ID=CAMNT_0026040119 /DNA_START=119 /DNA_END=901 /DNA_ORIENTATION=+
MRVRASASARPAQRRASARQARSSALRAVASPVVAAAAVPTVSDTKATFLQEYKYPIPAIWGTILGELLVQHHLYRFHTNYEYSPLGALGLVSVYDQVMDGFPAPESTDAIFSAFFTSLKEDGATYRADASALLEKAGSAGGVEGLLAMEELSSLKAQADDGKLLYTKWQAIGLFRLLEVAGATEPEALKKLTESAGVNITKVNADLGMYKGILSKLQAARELMAEVMEREKKKEAERMAAKAAPAAEAPPTDTATPAEA